MLMAHDVNNTFSDTPPHSLKNSNANSKVEQQKRELGYGL